VLATASGIVFPGAGVIGCFVSLAQLYERALFVAGAAPVIVPRIASDAIGSGHGAAAIASQLVCKVATA
jgi:hypothetical protein